MWRRWGSFIALGGCLALAPLATVQAQAPAQAVELAGVRYEASEQVGGQKLQLNGAGIRYKAIFKVYAAALYLPSRLGTPEAVYAATGGPRRLHITMLRDIDGNELGKLFTQGMEKNSPREIFARSINGTLKLAELFARRKKLASGESFTVDWVPGSGTLISVNGRQELEPIKEPEFYTALMSIWLGPAPADSQLKDALLGKSRSFRGGNDS